MLERNLDCSYCSYYLTEIENNFICFYFLACGTPKDIVNGNWTTSSSVELWDEYRGTITVIQQAQYSCIPRYKIRDGLVSYVNCDHGTNSFTPDPPTCVYIGKTIVL